MSKTPLTLKQKTGTEGNISYDSIVSSGVIAQDKLPWKKTMTCCN